MTNKSKPLIFFGNERILSGVNFDSSPILDSLIKNGFKIVGVVLNKHESRSRKSKTEATEQLASKHNIPVYYPEDSSEILEIITDLKPFAAVLVAYGRIVPPQVLNKFEGGVINIHPSLLPKYRGPSPIESALLNDESVIGVSLIKLVEKMDAGPIYAQSAVDITELSDKIDISKEVLKVASQLLIDNLESILNGSLAPVTQKENLATYTNKLTTKTSVLDPKNMTAKEAALRIRAYKYYPKTRLIISGHTIFPLSCHIAKFPEDNLSIEFRDGQYLIIDTLVSPSGKLISGNDFLRGYARDPK